jgi:hypothetical protein
MRTRFTPGPSTCQLVVRVRLAKGGSEVTRTLGVRDFGISESLGCSRVERPNGLKSRAMWQAYGLRNFETLGGLVHR